MDDLDNFHKSMQMLLMKKNQDLGELRFLTSRTTTENKSNVDDVCESVREVFQSFDLLSDNSASKTDVKCILPLKYLILNTNFDVQERLTEDIINGHLVDMCPPLSPYLLIQVVWDLKYEDVLVESLLHIPLDLCLEILDIVRRCIEDLEFERAMKVIFALIIHIYKRCILVKETGSQSVKETDSLNTLAAHLQEFLLLLTNSRVVRLNEVSGLKRYERCGIILKTLIHTVKMCLENALVKIPTDIEKLYILTFGREPFKKYEESFINETIQTMNQELLNLLLKKIKEIDCNIYLGWAELDDRENNAVSLQRSIGNDCYYFAEFLKSNEDPSQNEHLLECLQQLSSKPDNKGSILTIEELRHGIDNGNEKLMKELLRRYKEWNDSTLDYVVQKKQLLNNDDCLALLEYLNFVVTSSNDETYRKNIYTSVMKILLLQCTADIYEIMVNYIVSHDADTSLESPNMEENFNQFIARNADMKSPENVRVVLLFILQNPKKVLLNLLRITIGHPDYKNIMIPARDLLLFAPFMSITVDENETLLSSCLRTVCMEDIEWNQKKFADFTTVILDSSVLSMDDLTNRVLIPYMAESVFNSSNINYVLNTLRKERRRCTDRTDAKLLLICFAKLMSAMRKHEKLSKYMHGHMLSQITRLTQYFLQNRPTKLDDASKKFVMDKVDAYLEPIDRIHFAALWHPNNAAADISKVMLDYDRKCHLDTLNELVTSYEECRSYLENITFTREDYLRHLFLTSTEQEYHTLASDLVLLNWFSVGWSDENEAYDNLLRITLDACSLFLEYPAIGPQDTFVFLTKCIAQFTRRLRIVKGSDDGQILQALMKNVKSIEDCIKRSMYSESFSDLMTRVNDSSAQKDVNVSLTELLDAIDRFCDSCKLLDQNDTSDRKTAESDSKSEKIVRNYRTNSIISLCVKTSRPEVYEYSSMMNSLLFSS